MTLTKFQIKLLKKFVEKKFKEANKDIQTFDLEAHIDRSLSYKENKNIIIEKLKELGIFDNNGKLSKKYLEEFHKEQQEFIKEQFKRQNKRQTTEILNYYKPIYRAIQKLALGYTNLVFIKGKAGIGKSFHIKLALNKFNVDYVSVAGMVSDAYFYRLLYENNGKTIWFKDVLRLLRNLTSISNLKNACETDPEDLPREFIFTGKIIFDYNNLQEVAFKDDFEALLSRGEFIELTLDYDDLANIMRQIARTKEEKEVTEFLIKNYVFCGYNNFNLRTQQKAFQTYRFAKELGLNWKKELLEELQQMKSPIQAMLYEFLGRKAKTTVELKRWLIRKGYVQTERTAERRIREWLNLGEIYKVDTRERNFLVSLYPMVIEYESNKLNQV